MLITTQCATTMHIYMYNNVTLYTGNMIIKQYAIVYYIPQNTRVDVEHCALPESDDPAAVLRDFM